MEPSLSLSTPNRTMPPSMEIFESKRDAQLGEIRQILVDNKESWDRIGRIYDGDECSAEAMKWLEEEGRVLQCLWRYTLQRDRLAVNYESDYAKIVNIHERRMAELEIYATSEGDENDVSLWPGFEQQDKSDSMYGHVARDISSKHEESRADSPISPRSIVSRIRRRFLSIVTSDFRARPVPVSRRGVNRRDSAFPVSCDANLEGFRQLLQRKHRAELGRLYQLHCSRAYVAYEDTLEEVGEEHIRWQPPQNPPMKPGPAPKNEMTDSGYPSMRFHSVPLGRVKRRRFPSPERRDRAACPHYGFEHIQENVGGDTRLD
ncbi:hypothetical protein F5Y15DRAFT_428082 [Xylariaceae sp. FL0016]|nr:hypothetical protein F5Y15DRAFT_428082 [Xylariaceae sp. FL0016]